MKVITKTDIKRQKRCQKYCHLAKKNPEQGNGADLSAKLGKAAEPYFVRTLGLDKLTPGHTYSVPANIKLTERVDKTKALLSDKNAKVIYEASFMFDGVFISVDALHMKEDGSIDIYEFKTRSVTTKENSDLYIDAAIQFYVIKNSHTEPSSVFLAMLDTSKVAPNYDEIFVVRPVKEDCVKLNDFVVQEINLTKSVIENESLTEVTKVGSHCNAPGKCPFYKDCFSKLPEHGVHTLYNVRWDKKNQLLENNIQTVDQLEPSFSEGKEILRRQYNAVKSNETYINKEAIKKSLNLYEGLIAFFDFETISMPIPLIKGAKAWELLPFQFSCHLTDKDGNVVEHFEYLAEKNDFKSKKLFNKCAYALIKSLEKATYFVSYNESFELSRIKRIIEMSDAHGEKLQEIMNKIKNIDLLPIIQNNYYHKDLKGSFSIKAVLPLLVESMSYSGMEVANGSDAMDSAFKLYFEDPSQDEAAKIKEDLFKYCEKDTMAMVEIYKKLKNI